MKSIIFPFFWFLFNSCLSKNRFMQSLKPIKKQSLPKNFRRRSKVTPSGKGFKKAKKKSNTNVIIKLNVSELATTQNPKQVMGIRFFTIKRCSE